MRGNEFLYREVQHVRQPWIWALVMGISGFQWYVFVVQVLQGRPVGNNPASNTLAIAFWILFGVILPVFFLSVRLIVEVRGDGIYIRFTPFHLAPRVIPFDRVHEAKAVTYRPIWEYGGWGIRVGKQGIAYTISGQNGVLIELESSWGKTAAKRVLLGTRRPDALLRAIRRGIATRRPPPDEAD